MDEFVSAEDLLRVQRPTLPVIGVRRQSAYRAARWFLEHFPGKVLYAIKANNSPEIVNTLYQAGLRQFDVASLPEIEQLQDLPGVELFLMNPVKSRELIAQAYYDFGIRNFALDCQAELDKILQETGQAKDLNLFVRLACQSDGAQIALDHKFGIDGTRADDLLLSARRKAQRLGMTFHIGSQAMQPERYRTAIERISAVIARTGVLPDSIDVGGGFPSCYPGMVPPALENYIYEIKSAFEYMNVVETCELLCEPGRALVAEAVSALLRVELRKGNMLYLNDGSYGMLYDASHYKFSYPARLVRPRLGPTGAIEPFVLYGPTCDSADFMPGPFHLPNCVTEGDFLEIGQLGAYSEVFKTSFNGFGSYQKVFFSDEPMVSMYTSPIKAFSEKVIFSHTGSAGAD